jgi:hypothetical protein
MGGLCCPKKFYEIENTSGGEKGVEIKVERERERCLESCGICNGKNIIAGGLIVGVPGLIDCSRHLWFQKQRGAGACLFLGVILDL